MIESRAFQCGRRQYAVAAILGFSLWANCGSCAIIHCSSDAQHFQKALDESSDNGQYNGQDNIIHLVARTYGTVTKTPAGPFTYINTGKTGNLVIKGGYNEDCSAQVSNPSLTIIAGNYTDRVLNLTSKSGSIEIAWVTIEEGQSSEAAGILANHEQGDNGSISLHNTAIIDNTSSGFAGGIELGTGGSGTITVYSNLFFNNSAHEGDGAGEVLGDGAGLSFYNNTVYRNTSTGVNDGGMYLTCANSITCFVENNIFWNNTNYDVILYGDAGAHGGQFLLGYNDIAESFDGTPYVNEVGTLSTSPKFVSVDDENYRLDTGSPLLGASPFLKDGDDLDDKPYPTIGLTDIGAYEDTIYTDGFDVLPPQM